MLAMLAILALATARVTSDDTLLWGGYRPGVYVGMRPALPDSLSMGLMWYEANTFKGPQKIRHEVDMNKDIRSYDWSYFDPHLGGVQTIDDRGNKVNITTELVKSEDGHSWTMRVSGNQAPNNLQTLIFYTSVTGSSSQITLGNDKIRRGIDGDLTFIGSTPDLRHFAVQISKGTGENPDSDHELARKRPGKNYHYAGLKLPDSEVWMSKPAYFNLVKQMIEDATQKTGGNLDPNSVPPWAALTLPNEVKTSSNFFVVQKTFKGPFKFDIVYGATKAKEPIVPGDFDSNLAKIKNKIDNHISEVFDLQPPFEKEDHKIFARTVISNLEGGIGYFHGDSLVRENDDEEVSTFPARQLLTCTPSRATFPRGFYWDEGFHLLSLIDYDIDLTLDIVSSWFQMMDSDGWIGREQILGAEARSRVPEEFQVQNMEYANPPTLVTFLAHLGNKTPTPKVKNRLEKLFPLLELHFQWFRRSQKGEIFEYDRDPPSQEAYRWRGRTKDHVLTSGMDDYPRSSTISDGELHVDLLSWVGSMARSLKIISGILGKSEEEKYYLKIEQDVIVNLGELHWNDEQATYCDVSLNAFDEDEHICHIGYVSHLPLFLRLINPNDTNRLKALLNQLHDPEQLWSKSGIRSLSKNDTFFRTGENYWRGSIWVHMNYVCLEGLAFYAAEASDAQVRQQAATIYKELRMNVVTNVYNHWKKTNNVYEQYDALSGVPRRAKQFTGWTALVANIMAMPTEVGSKDKPANIMDKSADTKSKSADIKDNAADIEDKSADSKYKSVDTKDKSADTTSAISVSSDGDVVHEEL